MTHSHHFVLSTPDGNRPSLGVCKLCGAEREFSNAEPDPTRWLGRYPDMSNAKLPALSSDVRLAGR